VSKNRVIFKLDDQFIYLSSNGILSTDDKSGLLNTIRGLTKKELIRVVKGFVEQVDTINEKLNETLSLLDKIDSAVEKAEVNKCHDEPQQSQK